MTKAKIFYHDIGDYLSREEKLAIIKKNRSVANMQWQTLTPNEHGDWLNPRNDLFSEFIPLAPEKKFDVKTKSFFIPYSLGIATNKDAWLYNFSEIKLAENLETMISFYNEQRQKFHSQHTTKNAKDFVEYNAQKINWTDLFLNDLEKNIEYKLDKEKFCNVQYRPFMKQKFCYEKRLLQRTYQQTTIFPTINSKNLVICVSGIGVTKDFSTIISDTLPDLELIGKSQCFPLYYYEDNKKQEIYNLFDSSNENQYTRRDAISDFILERAKKQYGKNVTKEDIFYYVYGFLHSPQYRETFASDLKKMLPRLPLVEDVRDFWAFSKAGKKLALLHLNYELGITNYELRDGVIDYSQPEKVEYGMAAEESKIPYYTPKDYKLFEVEKMRFPKKEQQDTIIYNSQITIKNIPLVAYQYVVNGKSAIEWIMERYQITTHKESGIVNNPNDWALEARKPRYILDVLLNVIHLSVETVEIVQSLPEVKFEETPN